MSAYYVTWSWVHGKWIVQRGYPGTKTKRAAQAEADRLNAWRRWTVRCVGKIDREATMSDEHTRLRLIAPGTRRMTESIFAGAIGDEYCIYAEGNGQRRKLATFVTPEAAGEFRALVMAGSVRPDVVSA